MEILKLAEVWPSDTLENEGSTQNNSSNVGESVKATVHNMAVILKQTYNNKHVIFRKCVTP